MKFFFKRTFHDCMNIILYTPQIIKPQLAHPAVATLITVIPAIVIPFTIGDSSGR